MIRLGCLASIQVNLLEVVQKFVEKVFHHVLVLIGSDLGLFLLHIAYRIHDYKTAANLLEILKTLN